MPFIQIRPHTIINTERISQIRYLKREKTEHEYDRSNGTKTKIPGSGTVVSDSHLIIHINSTEDKAPDFQVFEDEADIIYSFLHEHIQVLPGPLVPFQDAD